MKCEHGKGVWIVKKRMGDEWLVGDVVYLEGCDICAKNVEIVEKDIDGSVIRSSE